MNNAPDVPNKDKSKGRAGRTFPVTFVVDQQLEACALAIKKNPRRSNVQIDLIDEHKDADCVDFSAALFHNREAITHIWGTMRRWQGTSTRIEGYARTLNHELTIFLGLLLLMTVLCLVISFATIIFFSAPVPEGQALTVSPIIYPVLLFIAILIGTMLVRPYANRRRLIRQMRKLFQAQSAEGRVINGVWMS